MLSGRLCLYSRAYKTSALLPSYKSVYNLENLYPNSSYHYGGISQEFSDSPVTKFSGHIPVDKVIVKYSRASGPGGQHVNKTSSKAEVRFHVLSAEWIPVDLRPKIMEKYRKRISGSGELIVNSDQSRYQMQNVKLCLEKIRDIIQDVERPRDPKKEELKDELLNMDKIHAAQKKRLQRKRMHGYTKSMRNKSNYD